MRRGSTVRSGLCLIDFGRGVFMFEWLFDTIIFAWTYLFAAGQEQLQDLRDWLEGVRTAIANFNPTQRVVLWIQFGVGILTVIWIVFQFAWLRRLNEARLERHLEGTISAERDELADERATILTELDRVVKRRGLWRLVLLIWAHLRLTVSLVLRLLSFGTTRGLADHNLLLMKVGAEGRARAIFAEVAREAIKKINLYRDAIENKTLEAQNALIFAGRVALVEKRTAAAVLLFRAARNLREDADARLLIGKQMSGAGALEGAMSEYNAVLKAEGTQAPTKSEAHRYIAEIHVTSGRRGFARQSLGEAEAIDRELQNFAGLARTYELIGDLHKHRADRRNAALDYYAQSAENYDRADMPVQARDVRRKVARLRSGGIDVVEEWWTHALERCGRWILRQVEKRRAREQMRAA